MKETLKYLKSIKSPAITNHSEKQLGNNVSRELCKCREQFRIRSALFIMFYLPNPTIACCEVRRTSTKHVVIVVLALLPPGSYGGEGRGRLAPAQRSERSVSQSSSRHDRGQSRSRSHACVSARSVSEV
ncbi:hypothetical protein J6590_018689 [Homalodisca vitripennis]|nr:hypothetical protein J6590_018689 [Homalodisca vitripennis]